VRAAQFASPPELLCLGQAFDDLVETMPSTSPGASPARDDMALMLYTSGTTGRPKGVPRSQANEYAATIGQIVQHQYTLGERTLGIMPLYHTMGVHSLSAMLALNGVFVCMPDWDAATALRLVQEEQLTCLYLVPTLFHMLVHEPAFEEYDVSSVRKLSYAGAPMLSSLVEACVQRLRPDVFVNHYGSTEVYTFSICEDARPKPGCAGRAAFHTAVRVVRAEAEPVVRPDEVVAPGETGEVIVSLTSPEAFGGYFNRPEATARAIRDGWYFTGDTGYVDPDGDLWVTGRVDDMIITGGENVQPVEVEEVLARAPGVREVAVAGLPDERWGQIVAAFIVPARGQQVSPSEIQSCSGQLAGYKRPRKVVLVKEIPKSPVGKILRRRLVAGEYEAL
jgi:2-furoate---CoA ligase